MKNRILSMLLLLALLVSCFGTPFVTEAAAAVDADELIVADWLNAGTVNDRGADSVMSEYADAGITDVYLLVKGTAGRLAWKSSVSGTVMSYSTDVLKATCTAAKKYGIRVHAWMMAARDDTYAASHSGALAWHFRVGQGSDVNQYINLRDSGYQSYMTSLVKELVANYDIAGIHLDTIRYGALYYDWGLNARTELINSYGITKAEYNAATLAMCVSAGYKYTTNSDGYYVYSSSGSSASGVNFAQAFAGSGSTDAKNGAKKFMQMRIDTVTNFVKVVKNAAGGKIISAAIMPEGVTDDYSAGVYGQSPAALKSAVDYICIMSYASQYGGASTWPASLAKASAAVGCNAVAAIQTFDCENSNADPTCTDIYNEYTNVLSARNSVNASSSGKVLGYALFRAARTCLAGAYVKNSSTLQFKVHNQDEAKTSLTKLVFTMKNGVTIKSISNKSGWGSSTFTLSSDGKTLTISNSSGILGSYGSASFDATYSGTVSKNTGACMLTVYNSSGEDYAYCGTTFPAHTHSYTSAVTKAATCTANGVKTFTCSCGVSYTETIKATGHNYVNNVCTSCGDVHASDLLHFKAGSDEIKWSWELLYSPTTAVTYTTSGDGYMVGTTGDNSGKWTNYFMVKPAGTCSYLHTICEGDIAQVRFRTTVTNGASGKATPDFRFYKVGETDMTMWSNNATQTVDLSSTAWQTVTVPLVSENYPVGTTINRIAFAPFKGRSEVAAKVEIDYIYIGQPEDAPDQNSINSNVLLDFTAGSAEASWKWVLQNGSSTDVTINTDGIGTLSGTSSAAAGINAAYFLVGADSDCTFRRTVAAGDVAQARFRVKVLENPNGVTEVTPDFRFHKASNGGTTFAPFTGDATQTVRLDTYAWQTVTVPLGGTNYPAGTVLDRVLFGALGATKQIKAEIEIDYLYVGQPSGAPNRTAEYDGDLLDFKYGSEENTWAWKMAHGATDAVTYQSTGNGSVIGTTSSDASKNAPYLLVWQTGKCSYVHTIAEGDVAQVRFRWNVTSAAIGVTSVVPDFRFNPDGNVTENFPTWTGNAHESFSLESSDWQVVTIPIVGKAYKVGDKINRVLFAPFGYQNAIGATVEVDYIYIGNPNGAPACREYHKDVETWSSGNKTHYAYCYDCREYKEYSCYFEESKRVEATCKADGYVTYVCAGHFSSDGELITDSYSANGGCGNTYTEKLTAASSATKGHSYTSKVSKQPTCTAVGTRVYTCSLCGSSYNESIAATGHKAVTDPAVAATCTTAGKTQGSHCSVCNAVLVAQKTVSATGHSYDPKVTKQPTCTGTGIRKYTCKNCGSSYEKLIDALGHSYTYTDNANGTHTVACSNTGCTYSAAEAHTFLNGACELCGAADGPIAKSDLVIFNKSLSLQSYVAFNFLVKASVLEGYDSWYIEFVRKDADKGTVKEISSGTAYNSSLQQFEYKLYSYQMSDELTVTLYAVKDGVTYVGESYTASVSSYVMSKIDTAADALKSVYANLLSYGGKAQTYRSYRTSAPADSVLGSYASYVTNTVPSVENASASTSTGLTGATLRANALGIASSVQLQFVTSISAQYDPTALYAEVVWNHKGTETKKLIDGSRFVANAAGTTHTIVFEDLCAYEGRVPVQVTIREKVSGKAISETWTYSIESYVALRQSNTNMNLVNMLNAMMNFYDAAQRCYG